MVSIPIIALNNLISTIICFLSLRKVYADYKQDRQNPVLKDFVWFYLWFGLFFITLSLPGLVVKSIISAGVVGAIGPFFLYMSIGYFMKIPLEFSSFKEVKNILFIICVFLAIFLPITNITIFQPSEYRELIIGNFKFFALFEYAYHPPEIATSWYSFLIGGGAVEAALVACILFFVYGKKGEQQWMYLMSVGMIFLMGAAALSYIVYFIFEILFLPQLISSVLAWIGLLIMFIGIYIKNEKNAQLSN